ncbi:MAG: diguanylate cyclase domain-containing protein [Actinomycetales bacterium]
MSKFTSAGDVQVRSVFQPIIDLDEGTVVAYEALARGPRGTALERPDALFASARAEGLLSELDDACRRAAFRSAVELGLFSPLTVFVNVEPEVLDSAPLDDLLAIAESAPGELRVMLEITERALSTRPAELLRTVERVRSLGWGVALDDVGAETMSLAFMPLLQPDVVKLDLRLVQERPTPQVAEIMNAVNAYAERSGALLLAEGIENDEHLLVARALGARLGQGWLFGRPVEVPPPGLPTAAIPLSQVSLVGLDDTDNDTALSPFACLPESTVLRRSNKRLLIELSKHLERQAMAVGDTCVVASTFQEARHFTPLTRQRYTELAARVGFVCALGEGLPSEPLPGLPVRGAELAPDDPVRGEWDIAVIGPHFAAALLARDLGETGPDLDRGFEFGLTYDRDAVVRAANALLSRVVPRAPAVRDALASNGRVAQLPGSPVTGIPGPRSAAGAGGVRAAARSAALRRDGGVLHRALDSTGNGVTISDLTLPDYPLVYANAAFERLAGVRLQDALGRNCRFLQGPDSDLAVIARISAAIRDGREVRETLLNYRGVNREPWWNEIYLAPVRDENGRVVQYIGVQNDVTKRVLAEEGLRQERERSAAYLRRIEQFAFTDALTQLPNRRRLQEQVEVALARAAESGRGVGFVYLDLDGFKPVNDSLGHAAGDELLAVVARRLESVLPEQALAARLGGDEFLVALLDVDPMTGDADVAAYVAAVTQALSEPVVLAGRRLVVTASAGTSCFPHDGGSFSTLLHVADRRMYEAKREGKRQSVPA